MTGHDLYAALLAERYGPTRTPTPPTDVDHPSVQAARRRVLAQLPPAPGRHGARWAKAYARRDGAR